MTRKTGRGCLLAAILALLCWVTPARADVSIGIGLPSVSIGFNLPVFPQLVPVPGYPVYYAPGVHANYFFYDGMYWVYQYDRWYASSWYDGPWAVVDPLVVPVYLLRVPVRYYREPPPYFRGWRRDRPPHWGEHWGHAWERHRRGWDHWNHRGVPRRAPLPLYQRHYSGNRYPHGARQRELQEQHYRYRPHDALVREHREHVRERRAQGARRAAPHVTQRASPPPLRYPSKEHARHAPPQHRETRSSQEPSRRPGPQRAAAPQRHPQDTRHFRPPQRPGQLRHPQQEQRQHAVPERGRHLQQRRQPQPRAAQPSPKSHGREASGPQHRRAHQRHGGPTHSEGPKANAAASAFRR